MAATIFLDLDRLTIQATLAAPRRSKQYQPSLPIQGGLHEQADHSGCHPRLGHARRRGVVASRAAAYAVAVPADGVFPDAAREGSDTNRTDAERDHSGRRQQ